MIVVFKLPKFDKEWWLRMAESEGDSEVGAGASIAHSSNGCCWEGCKVCKGAPCHSPLCKKCNKDKNHLVYGEYSPLLPFFKPTHQTPTQLDLVLAQWAAKVRQTGFDKWLEDQLKDPVFKEEYEKAYKEIQEYDRKERERRAAESKEVDETKKPS